MGIRIVTPGPLTTIQDLGRMGNQKSGFSASGVLDRRAGRIANILVGNPQDEAVLEMTLMGAGIEITDDCVIAVTGGDMSPLANGMPFPMYHAIPMKEGDQLTFSFAKNGCRTYLAFSGGIDVPVIMGSKSTNLKCSLGGYQGRALKAGDVLELCRRIPILPQMDQRHVSGEEHREKEVQVRVIPGPQEEYFTEKGITVFYSQPYVVTPQNDRMGCKLEGPFIEYKDKTDIISDGIPFGAIQIPSGGKPIIMLSDRQTTGGYAKIGTVASVDISLVVQRKMGEIIYFEKITLNKAQKLFRQQEKELNKLEQKFQNMK